MNPLDFIFDAELRSSYYKSPSRQWSMLEGRLTALKYDASKIAEARSYFESSYYPKKLSFYHSPPALFRCYWKGDIDTANIAQSDMLMKIELQRNGFEPAMEAAVLNHRKTVLKQAMNGYKQRISLEQSLLSEEEKILAATVFGEAQKHNDLKPSEEMIAIASLIKNRVAHVAQSSGVQKKEAEEAFGTGTYTGIASRFGSFQGEFYTMFMNNDFPEDFTLLKSAIASIAAARAVFATGSPEKFTTLLYKQG